MKVKYSGKVRRRIEGWGYAEPGQPIEVPEELGKRLCYKGSEFKKVTVKKKKYNAAQIKKKGQTKKGEHRGSPLRVLTDSNKTETKK